MSADLCGTFEKNNIKIENKYKKNHGLGKKKSQLQGSFQFMTFNILKSVFSMYFQFKLKNLKILENTSSKCIISVKF